MEIARGLLEALKALAEFFDKEQLPYCLIGGLAVGILAKPRATEDIDILLSADEQDKPALETALKRHFTIRQSQDTVHFKNASIWRLILEDTFTEDHGLILIDIIYADKGVLNEAIQNRIYITIDHTKIAVISPPDLVKIKRLSNRTQDMLDVQSLLDENPEIEL